MFKSKRLLLTISAAVALGLVLIALIVFVPGNPASDYLQQKLLSVRYRVEQILPAPAEPALMPTPLHMRIVYYATSSPATSTPAPTSVSTRISRAPDTAPTTAPVARTVTAIDTPAPPTDTPTPAVAIAAIQPTVTLSLTQHEFQGWNNCGPTTLKMDLAYYGRADTQKQIADFTKPDWDDKNVSPSELAAYVSHIGMHALVRQNGTLDRLKQFISNGFPVIVEGGFLTPSGKEGWMGHYRLLFGYDDKEFILMDSFNGPNQHVTFQALDADWRQFNRVYLVVVPDGKDDIANSIVGPDVNDATMFTNAVRRARAEIDANPQDAAQQAYAYFNLGTSLNGLQQYTDAAAAFDRARVLGLPWRMMWYQFGPYVAYLQTGRNDEVIALADSVLHVVDDLEESHYYKGMALRALGRADDARREFQTALRYNPHYQDPQVALAAG